MMLRKLGDICYPGDTLHCVLCDAANYIFIVKIPYSKMIEERELKALPGRGSDRCCLKCGVFWANIGSTYVKEACGLAAAVYCSRSRSMTTKKITAVDLYTKTVAVGEV